MDCDRRLPALIALALALLLAGCGADSATVESEATPQPRESGGALGGGAATATLASSDAVEVPEGDELAWVTSEVRLEAGEELRHAHEVSTVYVRQGEMGLTVDGQEQTLAEGEGAIVPAGREHVHAAAGSAPVVFWETRLAEPGSELPQPSEEPDTGSSLPDRADAQPLFTSEPLEGIPASPALRFIRVDLPPGTETSVHTHPGPEFIYGTEGEFTYQNALEGQRPFGPGDMAGIPPDTAVQKRNETEEEASFLSWFLVEPDEPFAPGAQFEDG